MLYKYICFSCLKIIFWDLMSSKNYVFVWVMIHWFIHPCSVSHLQPGVEHWWAEFSHLMMISVQWCHYTYLNTDNVHCTLIITDTPLIITRGHSLTHCSYQPFSDVAVSPETEEESRSRYLINMTPLYSPVLKIIK